ncbi:hypothetical protein G2W53_042043 [Senna tora]|uniref:Transposase (putative) gypsy type domain-containing protein n=1 Tax=Senna tora TaxID=362788 RepID=A0A834SGB4_9FABA|nr:hypothetical protein G2W53_042043 [Senna tora]
MSGYAYCSSGSAELISESSSSSGGPLPVDSSTMASPSGIPSEPWLVHCQVPAQFYGELTWYLRACLGDEYSLGLSLANPCVDESVLDGPPDIFTFYVFPLDYGFIMPPITDFKVNVLNYIPCAPSMLSPNGWLMLSGFQAVCEKLGVTPTVRSIVRDAYKYVTGFRSNLKFWRVDFFFVLPWEGLSPLWWFSARAFSCFPFWFLLPILHSPYFICISFSFTMSTCEMSSSSSNEVLSSSDAIYRRVVVSESTPTPPFVIFVRADDYSRSCRYSHPSPRARVGSYGHSFVAQVVWVEPLVWSSVF